MADFDAKSFVENLVAHQLIRPSRVHGTFARGVVFEEVLSRFAALIDRIASEDGAEPHVFPPVIDRTIIERADYLGSFPHLAGTVFSFAGDERAAREMADQARSAGPWADFLEMTDLVLCPAACYPVYPALTGELPAGGRLISTVNWVFRHEPSPEPTRMQSFRMWELVRAGSSAEVVAWRNDWLQRGVEIVRSLGLPAESDVAADAFFGRSGRILANGQKEQRLKYEVLVPVVSTTHPTALCSFNYHQTHFGEAFEIRTAEGAVAHTACVGFGLERVAMALFRHHGFVPDQWPGCVRSRLGL